MTKLYETENIPLDEKIIYQKWELKLIKINEKIGKVEFATFHWLIAKYDGEKDIAFGYANLNDNQNAEWGYISIEEYEEKEKVATLIANFLNSCCYNSTWQYLR